MQKALCFILILAACYLFGIAAHAAWHHLSTSPECDFSGATPDDDPALLDLYRSQALGLPYYENY